MSIASPTVLSSEEEEKQELETVLCSGIFNKAPNLQHFLHFVADKHFSGEAEQVKEYSIAVRALNRPETFDPQSDTIVRVTAHALRKKLEQYYATEGAAHRVQIQLPPGKYVLRFYRKPEDALSGEPERAAEPAPAARAPEELPKSASRRRGWVLFGIVLAIAALAVSLYVVVTRWSAREVPPLATPVNSAVLRNASTHILLNDRLAAYTDTAGQRWLPSHDCSGGKVFSHPDHVVQGTDDQIVFQSGREGKFSCRIPAAPGSYRLAILFADTENDKEAARQVVFTINGGPPQALDVVDEAGVDNAAIEKAFFGIHPLKDGAIYLNFLSEGSFANAVELTPTASDAEPPFRMVAGPALIHDADGNTWMPEAFFEGGRRTFHPDGLANHADARLYQWERYGHFHYSLPVAPDRDYTVRLYFSEGWFGQSNGGPGGVGSRLFDVYADGTTLLKNFDILQNQKSGAVIETIHHVHSTAHGMIDLYFMPVKNYALINAIEIDPET